MRLRSACLLVLLMLLTPLASAQGTEILVHPERAAAALDRNLLRAAFMMRLREWPDGQPIRVFVLPDGNPLHDRFCREQLGTYPYVLRNAWDRMVFTGTGLAPTTVRNEEEMRQRVRSTPGAIGYVASDLHSLTLTPVRGLALLPELYP